MKTTLTTLAALLLSCNTLWANDDFYAIATWPCTTEAPNEWANKPNKNPNELEEKGTEMNFVYAQSLTTGEALLDPASPTCIHDGHIQFMLNSQAAPVANIEDANTNGMSVAFELQDAMMGGNLPLSKFSFDVARISPMAGVNAYLVIQLADENFTTISSGWLLAEQPEFNGTDWAHVEVNVPDTLPQNAYKYTLYIVMYGITSTQGVALKDVTMRMDGTDGTEDAIKDIANGTVAAEGRRYNLAGQPATRNTHGIVISNRRKYVQK